MVQTREHDQGERDREGDTMWPLLDICKREERGVDRGTYLDWRDKWGALSRMAPVAQIAAQKDAFDQPDI